MLLFKKNFYNFHFFLCLCSDPVQETRKSNVLEVKLPFFTNDFQLSPLAKGSYPKGKYTEYITVIDDSAFTSLGNVIFFSSFKKYHYTLNLSSHHQKDDCILLDTLNCSMKKTFGLQLVYNVFIYTYAL